MHDCRHAPHHVPQLPTRAVPLQSTMPGDCEQSAKPLNDDALYAPLAQTLGGDDLPALPPGRAAELRISSLLPAPSGLSLPPDDALHARVRNRTLLLDKETAGRAASGAGSARRRKKAPPRWKAGAGVSSSRKATRRARGMKVCIPKAQQKYAIYEPLAKLWQGYAKGVVGGSSVANAGDRMLRMDFHGALVEIVRARDPGLVGVAGILVAETAGTIVVVGKMNRAVTVPKNAAIAAVNVGERRFEIALPMLPYRSSERSARKLKKKHMELF